MGTVGHVQYPRMELYLKMSSIGIVYMVFLSQALGFKLGGLEHAHDHHHEHDHDHEHNHDHEAEHHGEEARMTKAISFPGSDLELNAIAGSNIDFAQAIPTTLSDGTVRLCVEKNEFRTEVRKDPILQCTHQNIEKCHYTYRTQFVPNVEEVCDESFLKKCQISYRKHAVNETFNHCYRPLVRDCSAPAFGEETCRTYYESSCSTRYIEKLDGSGNFVGDTRCEKLPVKLCGDVTCKMVPGEEECHEKVTASVVEKPEEECDLTPQKTCRHKTTLVPRLEPTEECTTVPKEICHLKHVNPRVEEVPFKSLWCLDNQPLDEPLTQSDQKGEPVELPSYGPTTPFPEYEYEELPTYSKDNTVEEEILTYDSEDEIEDYEDIDLPPVPPPVNAFQINPEELKSAVFLAIQNSIELAVTQAVELKKTMTIESLKIELRKEIEEKVAETVIREVNRQTSSRRPQSSRELELAVKNAVKTAVEKAVRNMLQVSTEVTTMSTAMRFEVEEIKQTVQAAVIQAIRETVTNAVNTQQRNSQENIKVVILNEVRESIRQAIANQIRGETANTIRDTIEKAVEQAVGKAIRMRLNSGQRNVSMSDLENLINQTISQEVRNVSRQQQASSLQETALNQLLKDAVREAIEERVAGKNP